MADPIWDHLTLVPVVFFFAKEDLRNQLRTMEAGAAEQEKAEVAKGGRDSAATMCECATLRCTKLDQICITNFAAADM